jgi:hypothetical protein
VTAFTASSSAVTDAVTEPIPVVPPAGSGSNAGSEPDGSPEGNPQRRRRGTLLLAVAVGIAVSVGLGVYGRFHPATAVAINIAGFSSGIAVKAWLGSAAFALALAQLVTALRLYGKLGKPATGRVVAGLHRWTGRLAVLVSVPVAVHCLYALGFQDSSPRVLAHSLAGCFFYGAFAAKMLLLGRSGAARWALPVFGGLVFTLLTAVWLTSALWFFGTSGITF